MSKFWKMVGCCLLGYLLGRGCASVTQDVLVMTVGFPTMVESSVNRPVSLGWNDTLYVVPRPGYKGLQLVVRTEDSTGAKFLEAKSFEAKHTVAPAIK